MKWYVLNKLGMATLCNSEEDAIESASEYDIAYPKVAPHVATLMMPVGKGIEQTIEGLELAISDSDDCDQNESDWFDIQSAKNSLHNAAIQILEKIKWK